MASPCGMFVQTGMFTCDWETRVQWHLIQSQGDLWVNISFHSVPLEANALSQEVLSGKWGPSGANRYTASRHPKGPLRQPLSRHSFRSDTFLTAFGLDLLLEFKFETEPSHPIESCLFVWPMPPSGSSAHQYFKSQSAFLQPGTIRWMKSDRRIP